MPESEGGFKEFRVGDLFEGQTGDIDLQQSDINGLGEYFVNSGIQNCGIKGRTNRQAKVFDANTITIDFFGNVYYRPFRYKMATHNHVFSLRGDVLKNERVGLYIVSQLLYLRKVFSYNNMGTWPKIKNQVVSLPIDKLGNIDYHYMEVFIDNVYEECETKLNEFYSDSGYNDYSLTKNEQLAFASFASSEKKMEGFLLDSVFTLKGVKQSKCQSEIPTMDHGIPYIVQSMNNNMFSRNVDRQWLVANNEPPQEGNTIVLGVTLPAVSYQPFEFGASQVITASNPNLNESVGLYFATVLSKHMSKFSYQNKPGIQKYKELNLVLPVTNDGSIDYDFMENYINVIKKQCVARLKASDIFTDSRTAQKQTELTDEDKIILICDTSDVSITERFTRFLPLYDVAIACGALVDEGVQTLGNGDVDIEGWIDVSNYGFKPNKQMFIVHAKGESMLPKIRPGDLCVFEVYGVSGNAGSRDGQIVLARQHGKDDDYNCQYTIKEYHSEKDMLTGRNVKVELRPLNQDSQYKVIDVEKEEGEIKIIATLKRVLN